MRKMNKLISMVIVLVMLICVAVTVLLPVYAESGEEKHSVADFTTLDKLRSSGIMEGDGSVFAYTDFNSWTQTTYTGVLDETNPVYAPTYAYGGKFVGLVGKSEISFSDGAISFNSNSGGYFDVRLVNEYSVDYLLNAFGGKPFLLQADITPTDAANPTLIRLETRKRNTAGTSTVTLVMNLLGYDAFGTLARYNSVGNAVVEYITTDSGERASLVNGSKTTVAIIVIPSQNKYWVALDGELTNSVGYTLLTESDKASLSTLDSNVGSGCTLFSTIGEGKYFFSDARINPSYPSDGSESFLLDNLRLLRLRSDISAKEYEEIATPSPRGTLGAVSDIVTLQRSGILASNGSFFLHTGFDSWKKPVYTSSDSLTDVDGAIYAPMLAYSGNSVQLVGKSSINLDGGAVVFNSDDAGYFLVGLGNQYSNVPQLMLDAYGGMPFVIQADVKTASKENKMLFRFETKKRKADNSGDVTFVINLVGYTADGTLARYNSSGTEIVHSLLDDNGDAIKIPTNGYSTIGAIVMPEKNKYWVTVGGVATNTEGYTLLSDSDKTSLSGMDATVGDGSVFFTSILDGSYFPSLIRVNASYAEGESFLLDNVQIYKLNPGATVYDYERAVSPFKGASVSMEDSIDLNYYLNINQALIAENPGLKVNFEVGEQSILLEAKGLEAITRDFNTDGLDETYYRAICPVPAALVDSEVRATLIAKGKTIATHTYSVMEYAEGFKNSNDPATFDAIRSLLNYATAAEEYFGIRGEPANRVLDEEDRMTVSTLEDISELANGLLREGSIEGVSHFSASISLTSAIEMSHFFHLDGVTGADITLTSEYDKTEMYMDGERLRVKVYGIEAQNLDKDYAVTLTVGEESLSVTFSVMSYLELLASGDYGEELATLALALCDYNRAAELYAMRSRHTYNRTLITPASTTEDGLIRYTCSDCGYYYEEVKPKVASMKILGIGNSFTADSMEYLGRVMASAGIEVTLGYLYRGGCSLDEHYAYLTEDNSGRYVYYKTDESGAWTDTTDLSPSKAIQDEDWDVIVLGQAAATSGVPSSYAKLNKIINLINSKKTNKDAKVWWNMTWAFQADVSLTVRPDFKENYDADQMTMYNAIIETNKLTTVNNPMLAGVIPSGTAIQNLRTSYLGDTLTRDGYHLSHSYGRYTASLMWFVMLTGFDLDTVTYVPDATAFDGTSSEEIALAKEAIFEAVNAAFQRPMEITESTVKEQP